MNYISDIKEYIQQKISNGAEVGYYIKNVKIKARKGIIGEKIITIMNNGLKETQSTVLNEGDMIITNPSGEQYRVSADIFKERYTADPDNNGEYFPNPIPQKMLFLTEDISFRAYWGKTCT